VSVEVFFENPVQFRHELPELYEAMIRLLNQDPLHSTTGSTTIIRRMHASPASAASR
jgi:Mlc titration factor MtfA (ptsG expression regulator)